MHESSTSTVLSSGLNIIKVEKNGPERLTHSTLQGMFVNKPPLRLLYRAIQTRGCKLSEK